MAERISEAEFQVMEVLWRDSPLTAQDIATRLGATGWSLATVKTLLSRLAAKGALATQEDGRRYLYSPAVDRGRIAPAGRSPVRRSPGAAGRAPGRTRRAVGGRYCRT